MTADAGRTNINDNEVVVGLLEVGTRESTNQTPTLCGPSRTLISSSREEQKQKLHRKKCSRQYLYN